MQQISEELKNKLATFQTMQQQLQMVAVQKQQLILDKAEAEEADKELASSKGDVYKSIGPILVKSGRDALSKELKEASSSADARISILEKQEQKLALRAQELQKELQTGLKGLQDV